jgi:signal transduction histidine kinase
MLTTVVRNLLNNAVKYTSKGGTATLTISPGAGASTYTISVADTGTGMTAEQLQSLFRLDKPQSRRGTAGELGSGLGLIVCREMLQKHGSTLHVESETGKGSRFWFEIGKI